MFLFPVLTVKHLLVRISLKCSVLRESGRFLQSKQCYDSNNLTHQQSFLSSSGIHSALLVLKVWKKKNSREQALSIYCFSLLIYMFVTLAYFGYSLGINYCIHTHFLGEFSIFPPYYFQLPQSHCFCNSQNCKEGLLIISFYY